MDVYWIEPDSWKTLRVSQSLAKVWTEKILRAVEEGNCMYVGSFLSLPYATSGLHWALTVIFQILNRPCHTFSQIFLRACHYTEDRHENSAPRPHGRPVLAASLSSVLPPPFLPAYLCSGLPECHHAILVDSPPAMVPPAAGPPGSLWWSWYA